MRVKAWWLEAPKNSGMKGRLSKKKGNTRIQHKMCKPRGSGGERRNCEILESGPGFSPKLRTGKTGEKAAEKQKRQETKVNLHSKR